MNVETLEQDAGDLLLYVYSLSSVVVCCAEEMKEGVAKVVGVAIRVAELVDDGRDKMIASLRSQVRGKPFKKFCVV